MPRYKYTAKISPQKLINANIEAESEADAINKLTTLGYFPVSITPEVGGLQAEEHRVGFFGKTNRKEVLLFTMQLASLVDSEVNILNGINIIHSQMANKYLKSVLFDILGKLKDGRPLSDSLSYYPNLFSPLYCAMVRTGEASGSLDNTLKRLADFLEKEDEFRTSFVNSLVYPAFILSVGILTTMVLLIFVVPKLVLMFEDLGQGLPLPTKVLIGTSGFLRNNWFAVFLVTALLVFFIRRFTHTTSGKQVWDTFKLKIMFLGRLILKNQTSRFCRTLALLLSSGIPITPSLELSLSVIDNEVLRADAGHFKELISNGASLSDAFKSSGLFPDFVISIITTGEETGNLDKSLLRIAQDYEKEVDRTINTMMRLVEPVIILVMGLVVGFIVLSMLLPIFEINLIVR